MDKDQVAEILVNIATLLELKGENPFKVNAYRKVAQFFPLATRPRLKAVCARDASEVDAFARNWEWESADTDWRKVVERKDVDLGPAQIGESVDPPGRSQYMPAASGQVLRRRSTDAAGTTGNEDCSHR